MLRGHRNSPRINNQVINTNPANGVQEHLLSSEINKVYANRLRLKQRIKQFYGLVTEQNFKKSGIGVDNGGTSSSSNEGMEGTTCSGPKASSV